MGICFLPISCAGRCSLLLLLWNCGRHFLFNHLISILKVVFLVVDQFWQTAVTCTRLACIDGKQMMISQKMENIRSMYTPIYLFGKFAYFFLTGPVLVWGWASAGWLGLGGETGERQRRVEWPWGQREGKAGDTGKKYAERKARGVLWIVYMYVLGKGSFANEKIPPERLNQKES